MTDKEQFTAMLKRAGVVWSESVWKVDVDEIPTPGATTVRIRAEDDTKNEGYIGFFTEFEFSFEGHLLRVGVWE